MYGLVLDTGFNVIVCTRFTLVAKPYFELGTLDVRMDCDGAVDASSAARVV